MELRSKLFKMKVVVIALIMLANFTYTECSQKGSITIHTAYGYLRNVAVPEANRIRKAEEKYHSQQRIIGGTPASLGQYPYHAGLLSSITDLDEVGACGGTVLSENRILTAAHCWFDGVHQAWRFTIILGSVFLFTGGVRMGSSNVVTHPNWNPVTVRNDIAVVYTPIDISFSPHIAPIALPSGDELNEDFVGSTAIASGFGVRSDNGTITDGPYLNYVRLKVIDNFSCNIAFPLFIKSTNICTSDSDGGTCHGDSGGPLVLQRNDRSLLIGVTSFGSILGCEAGLPDAYTRVTSYMTFITQNL